MDIIFWNKDGKSFRVKDIKTLENEVLPKYFKHNNFTSFVRQLNMYNFSKSRNSDKSKEFRHKYFIRHHPELLNQITRKALELLDNKDSASSSQDGLQKEYKDLRLKYEQLTL
jgi:heat shock transcription factor 1